MQQVSALSVKLAGKKVCDINVIGFCKAHYIIVMIRLERYIKTSAYKNIVETVSFQNKIWNENLIRNALKT